MLTHIDEKGNARMVDVSGKEYSVREAVAESRIFMKPDTIDMILSGKIPKGDVLATARIAGIMAAKQTSSFIPMCHPIPVDSVIVEISPDEAQNSLKITAQVKCTWKTGVEMEALTAASVAALTIYDMCKAVEKSMEIGEIRLLKKTGGKSGDYIKEKSNGECSSNKHK